MRVAAIRNWSRVHKVLLRSTGGRIGRRLAGVDILLLTTIGRTSGKKHTVPLTYFRDGPKLAVIASFGGNPSHPDWFQNLAAHPAVTVELNGERFAASAREAEPEERERIWPRAVATYRDYENYQRRTDRLIPVVILERTPAP